MFNDTMMKASHQWARRPADERFLSLHAMHDHFATVRTQSAAKVVSVRSIAAIPDDDNKGLSIAVQSAGQPNYSPTHWSFGQVAALAEAPAGYLRTLHDRGGAPIVADAVNFGLRFKRNIEEVGLLMQDNGSAMLRAATGPKYGRIWNDDIVRTLVQKFGDGVSGDWRVPGEFGKAVAVTKANTTLYASDRDMFVFLANETNKIEVPNRRDGKTGLMSRGFWVQNSEVGDSVFLLGTFLFDYICCNRIVWGQRDYQEIRIRHTASAPDRWLEEIQPALIGYANSSASTITDAIAKAQAARLAPEKVEEFLGQRFGKRLAQPLMMIHSTEEGRPIESLWDVTTAATAYAREIPNNDIRLEIERKAGMVMDLAA